MDFEYSTKTKELASRLAAFMDEHIYPNEARYAGEVAEGDRWQPVPLVEELKGKARAQELWNLFLPKSKSGAGLTNLEYAPLCEIMGRVPWSPEVFNCSAPDTGNMETLERYGTPEQKQQWLEPLLGGRPTSRARSAATAATTSSTAASGGCREPAIRGARFSSSWARPMRTILIAISGSR